MKLRKITSVAAAAAVATTLAVSASATLTTVPQSRIFFSGTGNWMPVVYSDGTRDTSDKDAIDYGIDCTKIASVEVVFTPAEPDYFDGSFGGAIVLSTPGTDHNWVGKEYWGVVDEELEIDTCATDKPVVFKKTGNLTYTGVMNVDASNDVAPGYTMVQVAIQEWGQDMSDITVVSMTLKDAAGNTLISFDGNGNASLAPVTGAAAPADEVVEDVAAPAEVEEVEEDEDDADVADAPAADVADDEDDAEDVAADDEDGDVAGEVVVTTPAAGNTTTTVESSKGSPDTGVADVAAVAGLALVAGAAIVVAKKRK